MRKYCAWTLDDVKACWRIAELWKDSNETEFTWWGYDQMDDLCGPDAREQRVADACAEIVHAMAANKEITVGDLVQHCRTVVEADLSADDLAGNIGTENLPDLRKLRDVVSRLITETEAWKADLQEIITGLAEAELAEMEAERENLSDLAADYKQGAL